jgi:zinc transport system substrate-binding protein
MKIKFLIPLFIILSLTSCSQSENRSNSGTQKPTILVSLAPYKTIAEKIAGDGFIVQTIIPIGANPHVYEPTPKEISSIGEGSIWFRIGESFEEKLLPVLQGKNNHLVDADLRNNISLLHNSGCHCHVHTLEDRHIWLAPSTLKAQAETIKEVLSHHFPDQQELFAKNTEDLLSEINLLDNQIKTIVQNAEHRSFLVSHPAFAYFCKEYNLSQLSIEDGGKDPTPKYLTHIVQEVKDTQTKIAIAMPQHSNKGLQLISEKLKLQVHTIDPYAEDCFATMLLLAQLVASNE